MDAVAQGQKAELVAPATPFYGAAGGQVGDVGFIEGPRGKAKVTDTLKPGGELIVHQIEVSEGSIATGRGAELHRGPGARAATAANHTATHLLHAALREHLGEHVKQAGSMVSPERLRFDFSHFEAMTPEELRAVERTVNEGVRANISLDTQVMDIDEAMATGAMALFEERYGDRVRLVQIPGVSKELCGGTHTGATGDIGYFKIVSESSVAAGVRRLEALTGGAAVEAVQALETEVGKAAGALKVGRPELAERVGKLMASLKEREREVETLKGRLAGASSRDLMSEAVEVDGVKVLAVKVEVDNPKALRDLADTVRDKLGSGVAVFGRRKRRQGASVGPGHQGPGQALPRGQPGQGAGPHGGRRRRRPAGHGPGRRPEPRRPGPDALSKVPELGPGAGQGIAIRLRQPPASSTRHANKKRDAHSGVPSLFAMRFA